MKNAKKNFKKYNIILWVIVVLPMFFITLLFFLAGMGKLGYMPRIEDLENPKIDLSTQIISEDGEILGNLYSSNQNRTHVDFERLPKHLVNALVATEDARYFKHSGIDAKSLVRALFFMGRRGGGSTITQQFAKLLFHTQANTLIERLQQKVKEYLIAVKLEKSYTKEEIIALYFNQYDFLYNAVGIHSASQVYFNKLPDSLRIEESAVLVGMAKNSIVFNPKRHPETALLRRNTVLNQMEKYGYITSIECDSLKALEMKIDYQPVSHNVGPATYFREYIKKYMTRKEPKRKKYSNYASYKEDSMLWTRDPLYGWCNKNLKSDKTPYDIYVDGLRIYTTINYNMQIHAEEAVRSHIGGELQKDFFKEKKGKKRAPFAYSLSNKQIDQIMKRAIRSSDRGRYLYNQGLSTDEIYKEFKKPVDMTIFTWEGDVDTVLSPLDSILYYKHLLRTGFISMDPHNGHVKAYVGGINYRHFKYDHVTQGRRQAGSTFKPFLYILAMQEGYTPCNKVPVVPVRFRDNDTIWEPRSTCREEDRGTQKPLWWGLATSENYISAFLVDRFKPKPIADIAYKMGIESHIDPVPSMIYGTSGMSVKEMVSSFATFANKGVHTNPLFVTRIEDKFGNILATFHPETQEAISEETAFLMLNLMQNVVSYGRGTAHRLVSTYGMKNQIAGKTGTTNNNSDGWFIGITPNLVSGAWVGNEDRGVHFNSGRLGQGANMALPIWAEYMLNVYSDTTSGITTKDIFEAPTGFKINLNCSENDDKTNKNSMNDFLDLGGENDGFGF